MIRAARFVTLAVMLSAATGVCLAADGKPVKHERTWDGEVKLELRKEAPADGYVANAETFAKLWKAYRGDAELPKVDFAKQIVLVAVNSDPNMITVSAILDADGDLEITLKTSQVAYVNPTTCRYQFALVGREGVKTINGKAIKDK